MLYLPSLVPKLHSPAFLALCRKAQCEKSWGVEPGNEATIYQLGSVFPVLNHSMLLSDYIGYCSTLWQVEILFSQVELLVRMELFIFINLSKFHKQNIYA